ncbi:GNAT family N-acetyltransferase [Paraburkholderia ferrariae]|uniref:GNAT family N-acetyltransferase n=1 Tax=Paraburkholderia ferrariae TaxID=386056 RepID=UPI00047FBEAE|nr:GNAT family N-acetyltransferase [Paraburkholderia ferrariae]
MNVLSDNLGLATDLSLYRESAISEAQDNYIVVRTPDAPDYFFGNLLVLPRRPVADELERLEHDFGRLVGMPPAIAHRAFTWPEGAKGAVEVEAFVQQGYDLTVCRVLAAHPREIHPVAINPEVKVRRFESQQDWDDWSRMQLADMPDPDDIRSRLFMANREAVYRQLIGRGLGDWWGAFIGDEQVGSLGLFFLDGIGRFQWVITSERHRNQKVCKTLVTEAIRMTEGQSKRLVMVADEAYHAGAIYEAMGFRPQAQRVASLCQEPRSPAAL